MKELPPDVHAALVRRLARFVVECARADAAKRNAALAAAPPANDAPANGAPAAVASSSPATPRRRRTP